MSIFQSGKLPFVQLAQVPPVLERWLSASIAGRTVSDGGALRGLRLTADMLSGTRTVCECWLRIRISFVCFVPFVVRQGDCSRESDASGLDAAMLFGIEGRAHARDKFGPPAS